MNRPDSLRTILLGGLAVGALDGIAAMVNATLHGLPVTRLWQYVASGLLGPASFQGGLPTVLLGGFLEFFIATCVMAVFYGASLKVPWLIRYAILSGVAYGVLVFYFMNKLVVPLSSVPRPKGPPLLSRTLIEIGIHIFFVGLPAALVTRACAGRDQARTPV